MKRELFFTFLALVLLLPPLTAQQITLSGRVSIHNSKYRTDTIEYVKDAYVSAPFAGTAATDSEGRFGLDFVGMDAGTQIKLTAEKAGLEVVNGYELQRVIIGRKLPLRVFLAEKGRLAQAQTELYNISKKALNAKKNALIARLLGSEKESQAALTALEKDLGVEIGSPAEAIELLDNKIESLEKRLPEFAQELAAKNLDFASELYIKAYEHYEAGEIEAAIKVLDGAQLEQSYKDAMATVAEGKKLEKVGQNLQEKGLLQLDQIVESYELKAESHILLFQYRAAAAAYEKVIGILEENKEKEGIELANAYDAIGTIYQNLGEYSKAFFYREKNMKIKEQQLEKNDPDLATAYNNLASIYNDLGKYEEALAAQQKALAIRKQVLEPNHPDIAQSYNTLAIIYIYLGTFEEALAAQQKALAIRKQVLEPNHPDIAQSYNILAVIYNYLGTFERALEAHQKTLAIQEQVLESNHPSIAISHTNLALTYKELEEYEKALETQQKAHAIFEQVLEPNHPRIADSYSNLGSIYKALGDYKKALAAEQKALAIREQVFEPNHPSIANSYNNLALIYKELGDYQKALQAQKKDIIIVKQALGSNHHYIATSYHNLSAIYYVHNDLDSAIIYEHKANNILKEVLPSEHKYLEIIKAKLALYYEKRGQQLQGEGEYQEALQDFQKALEYSSEKASIYNRIGRCYYFQKDYTKAIEHYDKSLQAGFENEWVYLNNTGMAYAKLGQYNEAKAKFERLEELLPEGGLVYRGWAAYYALKGESEKALDNLEKAIELGYDNWQWIETDDSLDGLREHPRYQKLLKKKND